MAQWSDVWNDKRIPARGRYFVLSVARFTPPAKPSRKPGGKYPHLQPFFKNKPKEKLAA